MLAAFLYSVQILSLPLHSVAVLSPTSTQALMEAAPFRRPSTVALDSNDVAVVVHLSEKEARRTNRAWWARSSPDRVVVEHNGMHLLPFPTVNVLAPFFLNPNATNLISISNLVLSGSGKPVITLSAEVGGAYWALQEGSFGWDGSHWIPALQNLSGVMPRNIWVAASDCRGGFGYVGDYLYLDPAELVTARADNLYDISMVSRAQHTMVLGRGIMTAMSGNRAVGYDTDYVPGSNGSAPVQAIQWDGYRRSVLGAGIAWSVNAKGDVVGDNRKTLTSSGVPVLWHDGKPVRLGNDEGTAFAIGNDGTIIGDIKSHAFLIRPNDPRHHLVFLDDIVSGGWRISDAYCIADNGEILALATKNGMPARLVLLRPLRK